jgi:hypothetical protein
MNMRLPQPLTLRCDLHLQRQNSGRLQLRLGRAPETKPTPIGRVPRIARLMALAIRFEDLLRRGEVKDYAELAHVGHVTPARITQIMNLLNLAPDIQEQILFLPLVVKGREPLKEWHVRPIAAEPLWSKQRRMWKQLPSNIAGAA